MVNAMADNWDVKFRYSLTILIVHQDTKELTHMILEAYNFLYGGI